MSNFWKKKTEIFIGNIANLLINLGRIDNIASYP